MSQIAYQVFRIALASAGSQPFIQQVGLVHVVEFQDANGEPVLDGMIECAIGEGASQYLPLRYNSKVALPETVSRVNFRWAAQADTYAIVLFSPEPRKLTADTPPTRQLVTTSVGGTIAVAEVTCDTTADLLAAADSSRFSVILRNIGAVDCYLGPSGVTTSTGMLLAAGETITLDKSTAAVYGITAAGTATLRKLTETV